MNPTALSPSIMGSLRTAARRTTTIQTSTQLQTYATYTPPAADTPRWMQTPAAMDMPIKLRTTRPRQNAPYVANENPSTLDAALSQLLGKSASTLLPSELQWLSVTHKSFDHGRRGFNDKLAFLGKRIVDMQCNFALMSMPSLVAEPRKQRFAHPALRGVNNVTVAAKQGTLDKVRLAGLARQYGIDGVVRWKPRNVSTVSA